MHTFPSTATTFASILNSILSTGGRKLSDFDTRFHIVRCTALHIHCTALHMHRKTHSHSLTRVGESPCLAIGVTLVPTSGTLRQLEQSVNEPEGGGEGGSHQHGIQSLQSGAQESDHNNAKTVQRVRCAC